MSDMFTVLHEDNTAEIDLHDPIRNYKTTWQTLADQKAIDYAIFCFARNRHIRIEDVGYVVRLPEGVTL